MQREKNMEILDDIRRRLSPLQYCLSSSMLSARLDSAADSSAQHHHHHHHHYQHCDYNAPKQSIIAYMRQILAHSFAPFARLPLSDQISLLHANLFEIMCLRSLFVMPQVAKVHCREKRLSQMSKSKTNRTIRFDHPHHAHHQHNQQSVTQNHDDSNNNNNNRHTHYHFHSHYHQSLDSILAPAIGAKSEFDIREIFDIDSLARPMFTDDVTAQDYDDDDDVDDNQCYDTIQKCLRNFCAHYCDLARSLECEFYRDENYFYLMLMIILFRADKCNVVFIDDVEKQQSFFRQLAESYVLRKTKQENCPEDQHLPFERLISVIDRLEATHDELLEAISCLSQASQDAILASVLDKMSAC